MKQKAVKKHEHNDLNENVKTVDKETETDIFGDKTALFGLPTFTLCLSPPLHYQPLATR